MTGGRLFKRDGIWHFVRRVPQQFSEQDGRVIVRQSTGIRVLDDPRAIHASRIAEAMDKDLEALWHGRTNGDHDKALAEYEAARSATKRLGVSPPLADKSERTIAELLQRIAILEQGNLIKDRAAVQGLLDEAPIPAITFRQCAEKYIDAHKASWSNAIHIAQWSSSLAHHAYPIIGDVPVSQLTGKPGTHLITEVLDSIWHHKPTTAARVRGRIEKVLDWAKAKGYRDGDNPARWGGHLDAIYPTKEKIAPVKHHPAMPYRDIPTFIGTLRKQDGIGARALEFTILTAARTKEVLHAKRSEIDREGRVWIVPKEHTKMRREHRVPLCDSALKIIDTLPQDSEYLFPGFRKGKPLDRKILPRVLEAMGVKDSGTVHGFRSTFRDWAAEVGDYPNELLELAIAHAVGDRVEAAYRRGSQLQKRHDLMRDWEKYCNKGGV
jgi:integrase